MNAHWLKRLPNIARFGNFNVFRNFCTAMLPWITYVSTKANGTNHQNANPSVLKVNLQFGVDDEPCCLLFQNLFLFCFSFYVVSWFCTKFVQFLFFLLVYLRHFHLRYFHIGLKSLFCKLVSFFHSKCRTRSWIKLSH